MSWAASRWAAPRWAAPRWAASRWAASRWRLALPLLLCSLLVTRVHGQTEDLKLPNLGESSTSLFSAEFEHQLGQTWLRIFRSQAPTVNDPLVFEYLENLIYALVTHSQLADRRVDLVVVDNPTINAFAVPGGVIGVHNGLLLYAQTEDELATVLAHEIAHLSQRHFSRGVEFQKNQAPINLAAMLAGLVIMATAGGDAGMAALGASQALAQDSALRYSRSNEQEADRVGMQTLVDAGMDPHAAPAMFERMLQASRYSGGNRIPEFLRTHPLSENRIADTRNRARQYPKTVRPVSLDYQLMRARVVNQLANTPEEAVQRFRGELAGSPRSREAAQYGLVVALTNAGRADEAALELDSIWSGDPGRLEYVIADAEIDMLRGNADKAVSKLEKQLDLSPGNHPLTMAYANALMKNQQAHIAEEVLTAQSKRQQKDPGLWYLLAEVQGLSGNIIGLHQSRAEYFILNGYLDQAEKQLRYALKLVKNDYLTSATINQRLSDIAEMRRQMEQF
ncbi:M48 family peptidase [Seongchinamella sediminis]|uniref:Putative beta-barrel assembly-enhancing protease n=1 Tax=Seongchinamella sediminis TaxID=2283635 RepID=A0A3L7E3W3_9GAMM|nr:M48 family metalloprotease [Seongchinamella sediminis]RLQ23655.1 M48 family peptidase [Seongchinamella sediminis]